MEQRHAHVADVIRGYSEHHPHPVAGDQQTPLGADDGLRGIGGATGEDEGPGRVDIRVRRERLRRVDARAVLGEGAVQRRADGEHVRIRETEFGGDRVDEFAEAGFGDKQAAVGVVHVVEQVVAAPGVVEADHGRPTEGGTAKGEEILGHIVEQDGDVGRTTGLQPGAEQAGPPP